MRIYRETWAPAPHLCMGTFIPFDFFVYLRKPYVYGSRDTQVRLERFHVRVSIGFSWTGGIEWELNFG